MMRKKSRTNERARQLDVLYHFLEADRFYDGRGPKTRIARVEGILCNSVYYEWEFGTHALLCAMRYWCLYSECKYIYVRRFDDNSTIYYDKITFDSLQNIIGKWAGLARIYVGDRWEEAVPLPGSYNQDNYYIPLPEKRRAR